MHSASFEFYSLAWKVCFFQKKFDEAEFWLDKAIASGSTSASLLKAKGDFHASRQDWVLAVECFQLAVSAKPDVASFQLALAIGLEQLNCFPAALDCYREALSKLEHPSWVLRYTTCLVKNGEPHEALQVLMDINTRINNEVLARRAAELERIIGFVDQHASIIESSKLYNYSYIRKGLHKTKPGFGVESDGSLAKVEQAMAYGVLAWASALQGDLNDSALSVEWLVNSAKTSKGIGWGLGWPWSAFGKAQANPSDTIYGITTAICIEGLLATYRITAKIELKQLICNALDYYAQCVTESSGHTYFWYSDEPSDAKQVYNVSAMLAGVYAQAYETFGISRYAVLAEQAAKAIMADAAYRDSHIDWRYMQGASGRFNDVIHAAFIVHGLYQVKRILDINVIDLTELTGYLKSFIKNSDCLLEYNSITDNWLASILPARSWGLGMTAFVFKELGFSNLSRQLLASLPKYEFEENKFSYQYGDKLHVPRSVAFLLLAVAD